ncbi:hypothetical protein IHQ71_18540 [Rhizobium sp. TH2]|uniref:hypothetical protein n=1 Tax=Rhizobium sp. TH2 TaxID=2775403 RepID=UPI002158121A|nr:hypothetical protein [Rhizobium sp. TH2]UVC07210.1 hypothetical protein IHQ71_18540 [Rhizobium sp. TH2]
MIFMTALATGLFTAMLRSAFAVIAVSFMIALAFFAAFLISGAGIYTFLVSVAGFNAGLIALGAGYMINASATSN